MRKHPGGRGSAGRERTTWAQLRDADRDLLQREVAGLPSEVETDEIESRMFDLTALRMQVALAEGHRGAVERHRQRMVEIAMLLEEKTTIPAVQAQLEYLASMQESGFWEGLDLHGLEELRLRLRRLVPFLDKKTQKIVYTDFQDQVIGVRDEEVVHMPKMTGVQYEKKVKELPEESPRPHRHPPSTNQPAAHRDRFTGIGDDPGGDRRGRRPDVVDGPPGP